MNHHLDSNCLAEKEPSPKKRRTSSLPANPSPGGKSPYLGELTEESMPSGSIDANTSRNEPLPTSNGTRDKSLGTLASSSQIGPTHDLPRSTSFGSTTILPSTPNYSSKSTEYSSELTASLEAVPHASLPGLWLIENFITETEESELLRYLDHDRENPWHFSSFNGTHRGKKWGIRTDLRAKKFLEAEHLLPSWLQHVISRMQQIGASPTKGGNGCPPLVHFAPNEANAIDYQRALGHLLAPHCDDRQLSGKVLVNLCLAGDAVMTYTRDSKKPSPGAGGILGRRSSTAQVQETFRVMLPRRSLQVQSGTVRYDYRHGIINKDLLHDRRVSITFRQNAAAAPKSLK